MVYFLLSAKQFSLHVSMAHCQLTFDDVNSIMVDRSNTNLAAVICALLRSSFKSFCLSPVISQQFSHNAHNYMNGNEIWADGEVEK